MMYFMRCSVLMKEIVRTGIIYRTFFHTPLQHSVVVDKDSNITLIGINRPKCRNAINAHTALQLCQAFSDFEADHTSVIAVLYGVGGSFCSGYDLEELEAHINKDRVDLSFHHKRSIGPTRRHLRKPVICGINGFCVGGGLELALLCDMRVMEDSAVIGFFNRRFGVPIINGGTVRLPSIVGYSRALDLITSGRRVTGKEAFDIGLVNRLVATGTALGQAVNLAFSISKFSQSSLVHDRNSLYTNVYKHCDFRSAMQNELMGISPEVFGFKESFKKYKKSKLNGLKSDSWYMEEKSVPEWEKQEISNEETTDGIYST